MTANRNAGALAQQIRQRLTEAQAAPAVAQQTAPPVEADADRVRVTKDGRMVMPGEPIPPDAGALTTIPAATFHQHEGAR